MGVFASLARSLSPPVITQAATAIRRLRRWSGHQYSWDVACAIAGKYDDQLVNEFRARRAELARSSGVRFETKGHILANMIELLGGAVTVTNFGGATGDLDLSLRGQFPDSEFTVVENGTLVRTMPTDLGIQFSTEIPSSCDIFFSSGAIQYLESPYPVLVAGFNSAKVAVVLTRNVFSSYPATRVQRSKLYDNGFGPIPPGYSNVRIGYPHREVDHFCLLRKAKELGFILLCKIPTPSPCLPFNTISADLIFMRQCSIHQS